MLYRVWKLYSEIYRPIFLEDRYCKTLEEIISLFILIGLFGKS